MEQTDKKIKILFEDVKENPQLKLVILEGYVDSYNSKFFQDTVLNFIKSGPRNILLDCEKLNYLSSAGIGSFVAISEELKNNGVLVLFQVQPKVFEVFSLLGFIEFFHVTNSYEDALEKAQQSLSTKGQTVLSEMETKIVFPFVFECKICSKRLKVSKPGKYNCPQCSTTLIVDNKGEVAY